MAANEQTTTSDTGSARIALAYPLTIDGQEVTSLTMRRPKAKDMIAVATLPEAEVDLHLFGRLCKVNPEELQELDVYDYHQLQDAFRAFLSRPKTGTAGATPSSVSAGPPAGGSAK